MKPLVLCILDGVGIRKELHGNAVKQAKMPTFNKLLKKYPHCLLEACGESVGLPSGQMGNSEVGHTNIGAGRIVYQPLEMINQSIKDKTFFNNEKILEIINHSKINNSKLHIFGLLSDGGVHSHIDHLFNMIDMCKNNGITDLYIHVFLDGRDTLKDHGIKYIEQLEDKLNEVKIGKIATISGRYYAMDRDSNYDRIKKSYDVITKKQEEIKDYKNYIKNSYEKGVYDEFIIPIQVNSEGIVEENDGLITFNFRPDRLRQIFSALTLPNFDKFEALKFNNVKLVTMFSVSDEVVYKYAFEHQNLNNTFGSYISSKGLKQLRIAETEKYAHVTYFFDGGKDMEIEGSKRILIPSPKVATYDLKPTMSAYEITDTLIKELDKKYLDVVILNYANGDMVGHTGDMKATIEALECLDVCLTKLYDKVKELGGTLLVTADHGNSDYMLDETENVITSHSMSKVPFIITDKKYTLQDGKLSDIAPTMLELLNLEKPKEMTSSSLLKKNKNKNIFIIASLIIFLSLFITYTVRFIHYYRVEHPSNQTVNTLTNKIINSNDLSYTNTGFVEQEDEYIFKGKVENNYIYYSGMLFRIIKINSDGSIKIISDDNLTSLVWGYESDYENSYIRKWLNNNFYNSLINTDYIKKSKWCIDKIEENTDLCKSTIEDNIGLINVEEYKEISANNSYLNNQKYFWTINQNKENNIWYVFNDGGINSTTTDTYYSYGIRPVINLKNDIVYNSGDGTKNNPYIINNSSEIVVGSNIKYSNYSWKVVEINDDSLKLVMNECLKEKETCLEKSYSNTSSSYNVKEYNSLAYYLNNTFYQKLDKTYLIKGKWNIGNYNLETKYDYDKLADKTVETYVGLLNIADIFNNNNSYTITPSDEFISTVNENGTIYFSEIDEKNQIYPSIYINKNFKILSGDGTSNNPFIIE